MPLEFNGNEPSVITFNGNPVSEVYFNGTKVWPSTYKVTYSGLNSFGRYIVIEGGGTKTGSGSHDLPPGNYIRAYAGTSNYDGYIYVNNNLVKYGRNSQYQFVPSGPVNVVGSEQSSATDRDFYLRITT